MDQINNRKWKTFPQTVTEYDYKKETCKESNKTGKYRDDMKKPRGIDKKGYVFDMCLDLILMEVREPPVTSLSQLSMLL